MTRQQLEARRLKLARQIPDLAQVVRGSLFERTRRCGSSTCHCATGEGHTTTYLGVSVAAGKSLQITVPAEVVPVVRTWTDNYKRLSELIEDVSAVNRQLLRERLVEEEQPMPSPRRAGQSGKGKR